MGLVFNRRKRLGRSTTLNVSTRGASVSRRAGRLTLNSRGRGRIRLGKGFSFRFKL
jgi:hypothetical protein